MKKIAIHSVPRSGSTWLGEIMNSNENVHYKFQPLFSYAMKGRLNAKSSGVEINGFFSDLLITDDEFMDQTKQRAEGKSPVFSKEDNIDAVIYKEVRYHHILENMLRADNEVKVIGIVRNPLATLNSWLNAPAEFRAHEGWDIKEEWNNAPKKNEGRVEEYFGYAKWKEVALLFEELKELYSDRFLLVHYDDLNMNTLNEVKRIFKFCELPVTSQTLNFIEESKSISKSGIYSVYKPKKNDDSWCGKLDKDIEEYVISDLNQSILKKYL